MLLFLVVDTKTFCSHKCFLWIKSNHKSSHEFSFFFLLRAIGVDNWDDSN
jgi:hypothetical protein